jgi:hypothetical protein
LMSSSSGTLIRKGRIVVSSAAALTFAGMRVDAAMAAVVPSSLRRFSDDDVEVMRLVSSARSPEQKLKLE